MNKDQEYMPKQRGKFGKKSWKEVGKNDWNTDRTFIIKKNTLWLVKALKIIFFVHLIISIYSKTDFHRNRIWIFRWNHQHRFRITQRRKTRNLHDRYLSQRRRMLLVVNARNQKLHGFQRMGWSFIQSWTRFKNQHNCDLHFLQYLGDFIRSHRRFTREILRSLCMRIRYPGSQDNFIGFRDSRIHGEMDFDNKIAGFTFSSRRRFMFGKGRPDGSHRLVLRKLFREKIQ